LLGGAAMACAIFGPAIDNVAAPTSLPSSLSDISDAPYPHRCRDPLAGHARPNEAYFGPLSIADAVTIGQRAQVTSTCRTFPSAFGQAFRLTIRQVMAEGV
jgi:hypothetical protein